MSKISFEAPLITINSWNIIHLPKIASQQLASRGMVMVSGTINGNEFEAALEPDGKGSHWFRLNDENIRTFSADVADTLQLEIEVQAEWSKPVLPKDLSGALKHDHAAHATWQLITPKAQWEWLRWVRATNQAETRARRIEVACSKLSSGNRRPCCFNSSACSEPYVSKSGVLLG